MEASCEVYVLEQKRTTRGGRLTIEQMHMDTASSMQSIMEGAGPRTDVRILQRRNNCPACNCVKVQKFNEVHLYL